MYLRMLQIPGLFQALEYFPLALFAGMAAGLAFAARYHQARPRERYDPETRTFLIEPLYMPLLLLIVIPLSLALASGIWENAYLWRQLARIILAAGLYFTGLAALAPLLRRIISARARAALWVLPNLLYVLIYIDIFRSGTVILQIPRAWLMPVLVVWAAGAIALLGWHILSHLRFRKSLLASAVPELDDPMQKLWYQACTVHKVRTDIPLTRSPAVETPLSVGCFQRTMVLVLPEKAYTAEELELIYRHELRHIKRADMRTKIWMALWKSLLWFFPPVWWAAKITAEDLELCCDEEVLTGAESETRRRYAELLLDSAAPASGFSTCLSADAAALGRRLKQAISPKKVWRGDWIVGISAGLLMLAAANIGIIVT